MFNIKEGQTYICTKSDRPWWTEGKEYHVVLNTDNKPVIPDNQGDNWYSTDFIATYSQFKLKDMQANTVDRKYTPCDVNKIIIKAYQTYNNDAQRLAFIKGYFAE